MARDAGSGSSLVTIHKLLILMASLFTLGFGLRSFAVHELWLGAIFVCLTAGLLMYFRWFVRKHR